MGENLTEIIGIVVVVLVVAGLIGYFVMRSLKGTLRLTLNSLRVSSGENFTGTVQMTCRKPVEGHRLVVTLIGKEKYRRQTDDGMKTETREFYRNHTVLEEARSYEAGFEETYSFEHEAPTGGQVGSSGSGLAGVLDLFSGRDRDLSWKLEGRLEAKGIDLSDSKRVDVNFR